MAEHLEKLSVSFPFFIFHDTACKVCFLQIVNLAKEDEQEGDIYGHLCLLNVIKMRGHLYILGRKVAAEEGEAKQ